ncbi:MAG: type II secretion system protein [Candidatus Pacebacteria bacterium]|nr:type II secretion system protein [Candidatus Paceibacterota bacterium]
MKKIRNSKFVIRNSQSGMTLLELLVVLGIFGILATVAIFNYGGLQAKINLTNLANDVALQVVGAQNASLSGLLPAQTSSSNWKPSYGVYFSSASATDIKGADSKDFIYFVDLNQDNQFDGSTCPPTINKECISKYTITNNNSISNIEVFYASSSNSIPNLTITFARPNSGAVLYSGGVQLTGVSYIEITLLSTTGVSSSIDLYPSGRVQINS